MKRCVTAFATADRTVAAGTLVEDNDPLVGSHREFFVDADAELQAARIPGTDKTDGEHGGLPVSTQSGPGAAEAARRQTDDDTPVEQATAAPGEKRQTRRKD